MLRYSVYSWECGTTPQDPFYNTNDLEEAAILCDSEGENNKARWYVYDHIKVMDIRVFLGEIRR